MPRSQSVKIRPRGPYKLQFSTTSDRANPVDLDGATVTGAIYVLLTPTAGVTSVKFYKPSDNGAVSRTDTVAPFDLEGDTAGSANPTDVINTFGQGGVVLSAVVTTADNTYTVNANFVVQGGVLSVVPEDAPVFPVSIPTPTLITLSPNATATPASVSAPAASVSPAISVGGGPAIVGDTSNQYVEQRLLSDANVKFIWNQDHASGAMVPLGGVGFDENAGSGAATDPVTRSFPSSPALYSGANIGNVMKIRFPMSETGVVHTSTLGYGQYCRRRFSTLGLPSFRDLYFRYAIYVPADAHWWDAGKFPALMCVPEDKPLSGATGMSGAAVYNEYSWWAGIMWAGPSAMTGTYPNRTYTGDSDQNHGRIHCYIYAKEIQGTTYTQAAVTGGLRGYSLKARAGLNQDQNATNGGGAGVTGTGAYLYLNRGAWNTIEQRVTMNDQGTANGKYRLWLNDVLALNIQNIKWAADSFNATSDIRGLMNDVFHGGPTANATAQEMYLADYVMSAAKIGPRS